MKLGNAKSIRASLKRAAVGTTIRGTRAFRIVTTGTPTTATTILASALLAAQNDKPILNRRRYPSLYKGQKSTHLVRSNSGQDF